MLLSLSLLLLLLLYLQLQLLFLLVIPEGDLLLSLLLSLLLLLLLLLPFGCHPAGICCCICCCICICPCLKVPQGFSLGSLSPRAKGALAPGVCLLYFRFTLPLFFSTPMKSAHQKKSKKVPIFHRRKSSHPMTTIHHEASTLATLFTTFWHTNSPKPQQKCHSTTSKKNATKCTAKDPDPSQSKPPAASHTPDRPRSPSPHP